jgi:hypothetical protein
VVFTKGEVGVLRAVRAHATAGLGRGRGVLSREEARRKASEAGAGDAYDALEARVGAALRVALEKALCDVEAAAAERGGRGAAAAKRLAPPSEVAELRQLADTLRAALTVLGPDSGVSILELLTTVGAGVAPMQPLHVDGPFLQLLLALTDHAPVPLFDPGEPLPIAEVAAMVRGADPGWRVEHATEEGEEALNHGVGTCLLPPAQVALRLHRPVDIHQLLTGETTHDGVPCDAPLRSGDLVIILPWVRHAGPPCADRVVAFAALPMERDTEQYSHLWHIMPWTVAQLLCAPGMLATAVAEHPHAEAWRYYDDDIGQRLRAAVSAFRRVAAAKAAFAAADQRGARGGTMRAEAEERAAMRELTAAFEARRSAVARWRGRWTGRRLQGLRMGRRRRRPRAPRRAPHRRGTRLRHADGRVRRQGLARRSRLRRSGGGGPARRSRR